MDVDAAMSQLNSILENEETSNKLKNIMDIFSDKNSQKDNTAQIGSDGLASLIKSLSSSGILSSNSSNSSSLDGPGNLGTVLSNALSSLSSSSNAQGALNNTQDVSNNTQVSSENLQISSGNTQAGSGNAQGSSGNAQGSSGNAQADLSGIGNILGALGGLGGLGNIAGALGGLGGLGGLGNVLSGLGGSGNSQGGLGGLGNITGILGGLGGLGALAGLGGNDPRIALLDALSPFVNDAKKERIENSKNVLRIAGLAKVFENKN